MQQFFGIRVILKRIKAIRFMMVDKTVPIYKKLLIVLGILYLFLPIDLIPPILFPIGFIDDLILWTCILYYLRETLDTYWMGEKTTDYSEKFKNRTIIDNAEFEVESDKHEKEEGEES